jgi:hypothetical protein
MDVFNNDAEFLALPQEVQKGILEKFKSLPKEKQKIIETKIRRRPQPWYNEEGLQDATVPISAQDLDQAGNAIAESKFGQRNPKTGAALGTLVAKGPELAATASMLGDVKPLASGVEYLAKSGSKATGRLAELAKILAGPGKEASVAKISPQIRETEYALANSAEKLSSTKANFAKDLQEAKTAMGSQGAIIGKAETEAGLTLGDTAPISKILADPKKKAAKLDQLKRVLKASPDELATTMKPEEIYRNMKLSQRAGTAAGKGTQESAEWGKVNTGLRKVLEKTKPDFTKELDKLSELDTKLKSINPKFKTDAASIQTDIGKLKSRLAKLKIKSREVAEVGAKSDRYRKNVGIGAGVTTGLGLGYSAVKKLLN